MSRAEKRAKREEQKQVGKRWFLHHRSRQAALTRLVLSREEVARALTHAARQKALREHWSCWKELRAVEAELALHWEGDTFPSRLRHPRSRRPGANLTDASR